MLSHELFQLQPSPISLPVQSRFTISSTTTAAERPVASVDTPNRKRSCRGACSMCKRCPVRNRSQESEIERPKTRVTLVLSGGGAKAAAHVGVIQVLERAGIEVEHVVASSAGALVGLFYCLGVGTDEMLRLLHTEMAPHRLYRWIPGSGIGRLLYMLRGGGMRRFLNRFASIQRLEDLPKKLTVTATDVHFGRGVALNQGDITSAMLATMSLPGIMSPVLRDGRLLVDGSLANDLPVDLARGEGAKIVVAVDLNGPEMPAKCRNGKSSGFLSTFWRSLFLSMFELNRRQAEQADVVIRPEISDSNLIDFSNLERFVSAGEAAAHKALPKILAVV